MTENKTFGRRAMVRTATWAVPSAALAVGAPALASSQPIGEIITPGTPLPPVDPAPEACPTYDYTFGADMNIGTPDYSNVGYFGKRTAGDPIVNFEMEHYVNAAEDTLYWRPMFAFIDGAEAGATFTMPIGPGWSAATDAAGMSVLGKAGWDRFVPENSVVTSDFPTPSISVSDTAITFTWNEAIPAGAGGGFVIEANAEGGAAAIQGLAPYTEPQTFTAEGTLAFTASSC